MGYIVCELLLWHEMGAQRNVFVILWNNTQKTDPFGSLIKDGWSSVMKFLVIMVIRAAYLRDGDGSQILGE